MAFLSPDKTITEKIGNETITIKQKITPDGAVAAKDICSYVKRGDLVKPNAKLNNGTGVPKGITVHNTDDIKCASGTTPAEQYARATYPNGNMNGVAVHYWVWQNEIWQQLADNERGWHAADGSSRRKDHRGGKTGGNLDTISIECIETGSNEVSEKTLAQLVALLCYRYNLDPAFDVYTHNYWMHGVDKKVNGASKNCPLYILDHWAAFLETVKKYWNILKGASGADTAQPPAETPTTPTAFNVGDVVNFNGNVHYTSANAANGKACKSGKAKITQIYQLGKAKHPYHLVRESGGGATVWGWVDEKDVSAITATAPAAKYSPAVGDAVKINSGVTAYSNGVEMPAWVRSATLYIRQIEKNGTILLVSTEKTKKVYTGRVKASDVHKA